MPRTTVIAMFRTRPGRSPLRIDQTPSWQVNELMIRRVVMISGQGDLVGQVEVELPSGGQIGAFARTLK